MTTTTASLPHVIIEAIPLDAGVYLMHRDCGNGRHRIAWDSEQITRAQLEALLLIRIGRYIDVDR